VCTEHRGWKLQARWLQSITADSDGWVCHATRPASTQGLTLGRWPTSELALEHGRAYVDRKLEAPAQIGRRPPVPKRKL
jgi:hypothetical protein